MTEATSNIISAPQASYLIRTDTTTTSDRPAPPVLLPLRVHPSLRGFARAVGWSHWPAQVPEFTEDLDSFSTVAEWTTYRGAAVLAHLALCKEPDEDVAALLACGPFGYPEEDVPALTPLIDCLPHLSRLLLLPLAGRMRAALGTLAAGSVHDVVTTLACEALPEVDSPGEEFRTTATQAERVAIAAALSGAWYTQDILQVPLAAAYAVVSTVRDWIEAAAYNSIQTHPDEMRPLKFYDGPEVAKRLSVPPWARGLVDVGDDIVAWRP